METKQVTVQPAVGGMIKASKDSFVIPKEELKDFYLKFAFLLNPDSCSINRTEFELLNILLKDLKKILAALTHLNTGVRNRHMKHQDRHKNACHENEAGSLPG